MQMQMMKLRATGWPQKNWPVIISSSAFDKFERERSAFDANVFDVNVIGNKYKDVKVKVVFGIDKNVIDKNVIVEM